MIGREVEGDWEGGEGDWGEVRVIGREVEGDWEGGEGDWEGGGG